MTKVTILELFEAAFKHAAADPLITVWERLEGGARAEFFAPLASRIRSGDPQQLLHANTGACMVLGFMLMGVEEENLEARIEELVQTIVDERAMLTDMQTIAEGEPDEQSN